MGFGEFFLQALLFPLAILSALLGWSHPLANVDKVTFEQTGLYRSVGTRQEAAAPDTASGRVHSGESVLMEETSIIPGRLDHKMGGWYTIEGWPHLAPVKIRWVTRFPEPGVRNPRTGKTHLYSEYVTTAYIGVPDFRSYAFDEAWEIVPGRWVLEYWQGDRKLGEQHFDVVVPQDARN